MSEYTITQARHTDLGFLAAIELAAARQLRGHAPAHVLDETTSVEELEEARRRGRLWVALAGDAPVGFAHVKVLEATAVHLEEIDVLPDHARRGIGTRLIAAILAWAADAGYRALTLTTFRDVPWNMPYYARLGFGVIPADELSPTLRSLVEDEARRGLDPSRRVVMRCRWQPGGPHGNIYVRPESIYRASSVRANSVSSTSLRSETAQNDIPSRDQ